MRYFKKKIDIEAVIQMAKDNKDRILKNDIANDLDDTTKFLLNMKIKDGIYKVPTHLAYRAYKKWSMNPVKKTVFYQSMSKLFITKMSKSDKPYYELNYTAPELINEVMQRKEKHE